MPRARAIQVKTVLAALWLSGFLAACGGGIGSRLENPGDVDLSAKAPTPLTVRGTPSTQLARDHGSSQFFPGQPQTPLDTSLDPPPGVREADGKFTINVDHADINEVAKLVLGETLGFNYVIDPRVQGTVTLSSSSPLSSREVLDAFEAALRLDGAGLVITNGVAKIVALQELVDGQMGAADMAGATSPGFGVSAVPLHFISPANMMELMDSFIARSGNVRASNTGNLILIRGSAEERKSLVDVVLSFDVDWMRSQSASIAILANSSPEELVSKLEAVFAQDTTASGSNGIKVIPLERLNGVIVIGNSREKVRRALTWVSRLDKASTTDTNYYVYAVQNGNADDLAKILMSTFVDKSDAPGLTSEVAPNQPTVQLSTNENAAGGQAGSQTGTQGSQGAQPGTYNQANQAGKTDLATSQTSKPAQQEQPNLSTGIRITANVATNTLVIRANQREYSKILAMLRQIDSRSVQVLINTTIAEVALNNDLQYGVQAYFSHHGAALGISNSGTGAGSNGMSVSASFPGLNVLFGGLNNPQVVLNALSAVTSVKIVSSPSLLVLENETATIKVGNQVPILTQTQSYPGVTTTPGTSVNSYEYHNTGVTLKVKPRVNAGGLVTMEIEQDLSAVTTSAGTTEAEKANPTFTDRSVTSKVSVYSSQTVALGGLISGQDTHERSSVPIINKIPVIGSLLGSTNNVGQRNEMIVFITPQIIQDGQDASRVSEELRSKMKFLNRN